jgi:thymidylate synthase (FAD)
MKCELIYNTPLWVCAKAIRKCWNSEKHSDSWQITGLEGDAFDECGEKDKELIHKVGNKNKHASTLEHLVYTFDISDISRACLQELARHRMASLSVKSTRYTLKELKNEKLDFVIADEDEYTCTLSNEEYEEYEKSEIENYNMLYRYKQGQKYLVFSDNQQINNNSLMALDNLRMSLVDGIPNDIAKYCLPEAFKTSLVWTINARSLQNFLSLRTFKSALWEIRDLAYAIYKQIPSEHKYLFKEFLYEVPTSNS